MSQAGERSTTFALVATLPERTYTKSGACLDPRADVWQWYDGPFQPRMNFKRINENWKDLLVPLKLCLLHFVKGYSASYAVRLFEEFFRFARATKELPESVVTVREVSNYSGELVRLGRVELLGVLNALLQKWVALGLPGVLPECATYLLERRKPGGKKGEPVRTHDPFIGPFTEDEYTNLHTAVNSAYGRGALPLWALLLMRLMFACGGRISQYASLKISDFDAKTRVLQLPQVKTGAAHSRCVFLAFDISPQTTQLILSHLDQLAAEGCDGRSAFFPEFLITSRRQKTCRAAGDLFFGHCLSNTLASRFQNKLEKFSPPAERLDFAPLPIATRRFRYTFGTRLAEEGASKVVIANRLGHADLQHVDVYVEASPRVVANIDKAMGTQLAPLARAFRGQLVENEEGTTQQGAPGSRIVDFRVSTRPVGSCAEKGSGCAFSRPVACYTCFRFEPWLDGPHEKVLERLLAERKNSAGDARIAVINDESIRAVQEVLSDCEEVRRQRSKVSAEAAE